MSFQDEVIKIRNDVLNRSEYREAYDALNERIAESQKQVVERAQENKDKDYEKS